jgi:excisionase family DNA binding protein
VPLADIARLTGARNRSGHGLGLARCAVHSDGEGQRGGPPVTAQDDILTTEEAAKLLRVSERTLERWRVRRRIPYVEYPRQGTWAPIRFRRTDILEWLRQHVVKPTRNGDQPA